MKGETYPRIRARVEDRAFISDAASGLLSTAIETQNGTDPGTCAVVGSSDVQIIRGPARPSLVRSVISAPLRLCHTRPIAGSGCGDMVAHLQLFGFRARSTRQHRQHLSDLRRKHRFFEIRALALKKIRSAQSDRLHPYLEGLMVCTRQAWYLLSPGSVAFILILDLRMPKKDGLEVVAELMSQRPRPPIIVFTNSDKATDIWRALPAGDKG